MNYHFYYIKDLLGNIRETYIHPEAGYKECMERTQYYPSGLPWVERYSNSEGAHPWKYNGKEFVEMHGLDEYDSKARWYYPAICRTTTMDPLAEKYYSTSPYAWCGNNPVGNVDLDGKEVQHWLREKEEIKDIENWRKYYDDDRLHLWFHGGEDGKYILYANNTSYLFSATDTEDFGSILYNDVVTQEKWLSYTSDESIENKQVVLHGCYSAKLAENMAKAYPGIYFSGTTLENHTQRNFYGNISKVEEAGIYKEILSFWKIDGVWQTFYTDPNTLDFLWWSTDSDTLEPFISE